MTEIMKTQKSDSFGFGNVSVAIVTEAIDSDLRDTLFVEFVVADVRIFERQVVHRVLWIFSHLLFDLEKTWQVQLMTFLGRVRLENQNPLAPGERKQRSPAIKESCTSHYNKNPTISGEECTQLKCSSNRKSIQANND